MTNPLRSLAQRRAAGVPDFTNTNAAALEIREVRRSYRQGADTVDALRGLSLTVNEGKFLAIMGPSGSGKSTLLNLIAGIDRPTSGSILVQGRALNEMSDRELSNWRSSTVGLVFQFFNLIPVLTARENVALPLLLTRLSHAERKRRAQTALRIVGLEHRLDHRPAALSGGEQQRVAVARAIVSDPAIIVADEPTGDLDVENAESLLGLLRSLSDDFGKTIVMVTHDVRAGRFVDRVFQIDKGQMVAT